eukprot:COSAG02_NODE_588_length_19902_cov_115.928900_14_plen_116_part_00
MAQRHGCWLDTAYAFVQEVFEQLDTDGSGTLSKAEVAGLKELVEKYVEEKRSSQDPDEMVTYEEFEAKFQPGGECKSAASRMFEHESTWASHGWCFFDGPLMLRHFCCLRLPLPL